ncbi:MAG: hypothetical protein LBW77_03005 [Verrucomicrobiota bacterium]|nr:hypothetical protein [Verrucomicrobiota bacterium]
MKNCFLYIALCVLFAGPPAQAGAEFGAVRNYPHLGFKMPLLEHAKAEPVPMPLARTFLSVGEPLAREDRFDPYELWYGSECCARWIDPAGNRLVLGRVTHRLPDFPEESVSRDLFFRVASASSNVVNPREREQVDEWVATFAGVPVYEPESLKLNLFSLDSVLRYPCGETNTLVYAFRPRRVGSGSAHDWFCVILSAAEAEDPLERRAAFEADFIARLGLPSRTSKDTGVAAEELSADGKDHPQQPEHPVVFEALKSIENYDDWWYAKTDGYVILSDVTTEVGKGVIEDLKVQLPALRRAYEKLVPPLARGGEPALLRLFQTREDYVRYVGEEHEWSAGLWMPGRRELVLFQQESKDATLKIIRHEAFHQYLSYATAMLGAAPWLNEGHACFFENADVDAKGRVTLPEDPDRAPLLLENLDTAVALLPGLLGVDYEEFYDGTQAGRRLKYAMAWGVAYYLQKGVPLERESPDRLILSDYLASLSLIRDRQQATLLAFSEIEMEKFQERFRDFWLRHRRKGEAFNPLKK